LSLSRCASRGHFEDAYLSPISLEGAKLIFAHLENADLRGANLKGAILYEAHLEGAKMSLAHLENADLYGAFLERADLGAVHLSGVRLSSAHLSADTRLSQVILPDQKGVGPYLADIQWGGANLSDIAWSSIKMTREEYDAAKGETMVKEKRVLRVCLNINLLFVSTDN
jgi:uncharacterized protein YjbI with pentapeptide repeats